MATMRPASGIRVADDAVVAAAVPSLVMAERDFLGEPQKGEAAAREDARADRRVGLHERELFVA